MEKKVLFIIALFIYFFSISNVFAEEVDIDQMVSSMSNEEKIAQMIMPAFRTTSGVAVNEDNVEEILSTYGYAGVILFAENTTTIEETMRFVDFLQESNKNHDTQLLISIDQEGGYVSRLAIGTELPGNMALAATDDPESAYEAGKIIGEELALQGINTDLGPVLDLNSNPNNPVAGLRSFSDDPEIASLYGEKYMEGLQEEGVISAIKHFPGSGDAANDTHEDLDIINKTHDELVESDLVPFQNLIDNGAEMVVASHIQYPIIEQETYVSLKDGKTYTLPASLSKTILTDILRDEMGFEGVIITDAFDMAAIAEEFDKVDASIKAINAGANIILMPFIYDKDKDALKAYVQTLASKVGNEISLDRVNDSVKRILTLKYNKGLLNTYDGSDLEDRIALAKTLVSTKESHEVEFELALNAVTMIQNNNDVLPLNPEEKTIIFYEYGSHLKALDNAIAYLEKDGTVMYPDNITMYYFYDNTGHISLDTLKAQLEGFDNVVMIRAQYHANDLTDPDLDKMVELIDYAHEQGKKVVFMESHLPYEIAKFVNADSLVLTYLANGIRFLIDNYDGEIPKYGPNIIAGFYMLFSDKMNMNGILPVILYGLDENEAFTDEVIFARGFGLHYYNKYHIISGDNQDYQSGNDLVITADGNKYNLLMLRVDGIELAPSNYRAEQGSTIVTLYSSYLSTLSTGSHTLTFVYNDGEVDATFTILGYNNPQTGDSIFLYVVILIVSVIGISTMGILYKTKNYI